MQRIAIVGCSGSGKSTMAASLAAALGCPHIELDAIYHQPGWTELEPDEFRRRVRDVADAPSWVVDGNYSVASEIVWRRADTVVWIDLPYVTVMGRIIWRTVRRVVLRTELWNGNTEPWSNLWPVNPETSIIAWAATRHRVYRQRYAEAAVDPKWAGLSFVRLRSQHDVDRFVHRAASLSLEGGMT